MDFIMEAIQFLRIHFLALETPYVISVESEFDPIFVAL